MALLASSAERMANSEPGSCSGSCRDRRSYGGVEGEALREAFPDGGELFFPAGRDGVEAVCRESGMTVWGMFNLRQV